MEENTDGVDVLRRVGWRGVEQYFWRGAERRSSDVPLRQWFPAVEPARRSEINQRDATTDRTENVRRLDVTVNDSHGVERCYTVANGECDINCLGRPKWPLPCHDVLKRLAADQF